jgi:hypothetical protein
MNHSPDIVSKALFQSLIEQPPLLADLPEATTFPCKSLVFPKEICTLNLQQKLGHLYEDALAVLLESTPQYDVLAQGLPIRQDAGHTLGELDYLLRDLVSGRTIHLELAVKFYLAVETESGLRLPGPDARDHYFRKLEKMRSHQLILVDKFRDLLPDEFRDKEVDVQQLVHGCIFNHVRAARPVQAEFLNPNGRRGKWLHAEECVGYFGKHPSLEVIPKPLWPVSMQAMAGMELEEWQVDEDIDRCVMVRRSGGADDEDDTEGGPYFIAPNGYPAMRKAGA